MRLRSVVSEAVRDLLTGTSRAALLAALFALTVGGLAVADVRTVEAIEAGASQFRAAGGAVQTIDAPAHVDGRQCEALASASQVGPSGALREGRPLRALAMPSSQLPVWDVTPGFLEVLATSTSTVVAAGGGVWLSAELAEVLGAQPGDELETSAGSARVAGVYEWPEDGRTRAFGYALLTPVPAAGSFTQCWAETWPVTTEGRDLLRAALAPGAPTAQVTQQQLNSTGGQEYDADSLLAARVTRWAAAAALLAGLALGWAAVRIRRLELASALHARVPKAHLAWQHVVEAAVWVVAGVVLSCSAVTWAAGSGPGTLAWSVGFRPVLAAAAAALLGTVAAVAVTRERHLFRYFKER